MQILKSDVIENDNGSFGQQHTNPRAVEIGNSIPTVPSTVQPMTDTSIIIPENRSGIDSPPNNG